MPHPNAGESEQAYVGRFMASAEARRDYPDEKQRAAVAYSMFREKKNNSQICGACGCAMTMQPDAVVNDCAACGNRVLGPVTPPVENIENLCPDCRHAVAGEHDEFGCHLDGCGCARTGAGLMEQMKALMNAYPATDRGAWGRLDEAGRKAAVAKAGVSETYAYVVKWDAIPQDIREKIGVALTGLPNAGAPERVNRPALCPKCLYLVGGIDEGGRKTVADKRGVAHIVESDGAGHVETSCGAEPCCDNSGEHLNAIPDSAWKRPADYVEGYCKTCDYATPGFHKNDCPVLARERAAYDKLWRAEKRNSDPKHLKAPTADAMAALREKGLEGMEDEDLSDAGRAAKRAALAEGHERVNADPVAKWRGNPRVRIEGRPNGTRIAIAETDDGMGIAATDAAIEREVQAGRTVILVLNAAPDYCDGCDRLKKDCVCEKTNAAAPDLPMDREALGAARYGGRA